VDGTDGDTWLDDVDATLGRSHLQVQGKIVRVLAAEAGGPLHSIGHDIALTVNVDRGRIEDFVRLASKGPSPLLTGNLNLKTTLHIPPGPTAVHERMKLNGQFRLDEAKFASEKIQDRIESLSLRGQGRPGEVKTTDSASMRSQMQGDFRLADGVVTLPSLTYTVPGAVIQLKGTYGLEGGALAFTGTAKTQATVSRNGGSGSHRRHARETRVRHQLRSDEKHRAAAAGTESVGRLHQDSRGRDCVAYSTQWK
jgi:hypothetical protein